MFETLKRLFYAGRLSDEGLQNAVEKDWITAEQKAEIEQQ